MLSTIFGSCRQESFYEMPELNITGIRDNISYTHYTKEILEVIKFCKHGHISPEETTSVFRTPIIKNQKLFFNDILKQNFINTRIFILEIASRTSYLYNGNYVHHILFDNENFNKRIIVNKQTDEEIENDIIQIKYELNDRHMIIVGHIVTHYFGNRYELLTLLENICEKHNIYFINPVKELTKLGYKVKTLLMEDGTHYNDAGHAAIKQVYCNFIRTIKNQTLYNANMENQRLFVCSRGLLKSTTFHSLNPKSSCDNDYSYLNDMLISNNLRDGMSIYVCNELLKWFVVEVLPKIKHKFVLVTGDSDLCVPKEALTNSETVTLINNSYLLKWFAQNTQIQRHEKIIQLPIGLDYHTISNNPNFMWRSDGEGHLPKDQEDILINLRQQMKPFYERTPIIYVNFTQVNDKFGQRKQSLEQIPKELLYVNQSFTKRTENWKNIMQSAFVLSPFGMGMDCHRTWEALCLGAIPIVKAPNFQQMFDDLPVLIVNEWNEITCELLDKTIKEFKTRDFKYEKLTLQYWVKMINSYKIF
jgi:hypothetical protein